jgi:hypothetical protein
MQWPKVAACTLNAVAKSRHAGQMRLPSGASPGLARGCTATGLRLAGVWHWHEPATGTSPHCPEPGTGRSLHYHESALPRACTGTSLHYHEPALPRARTTTSRETARACAGTSMRKHEPALLLACTATSPVETQRRARGGKCSASGRGIFCRIFVFLRYSARAA